MLGSELLINGHPFTIVGITPRGFTGTMQVFSAEVWLPLSNYDRVANDFEQENKSPFGEQELLLPRNTQLKVTDSWVDPATGFNVQRVKVAR